MTELTMVIVRENCRRVHVTQLMVGEPVVLWRDATYGEYAMYLGRVEMSHGFAETFRFDDGDTMTLMTVEEVWVPKVDPFECEIPL